MPFILVTGCPSSGKTTITDRIIEFFKEREKEVVVIKDEDYSVFNRSQYSNSTKEKDHRSFVRSAVQKNIGKNTTVICDGLNYIKGYRYELFLVGKLAKTTFCVVHCDATEETCKWLDLQKEESSRYPDNLLAELFMRYEKPDPRNRWDTPLFEIKIGKAERSLDGEIPDDMTYDLEYPSPRYCSIPLDDIYNWIYEGTALKENKSTATVPLAPTNYLHDLDRTTQEVVSVIMTNQQHAVVGQQIIVPVAEEGSNSVDFKKIRSAPELARLRRQFITMSKMHPIEGSAKIATLFINFLNTTSV